MSEKSAIGYARELVASLWHSFPEDAEQPIAAAIAAAEERGRRRGLEERDGLLKRLEAAQRALGGFNYVEWGRAGGEPECEHGYFIATPCRACDVEFVRTGKARVAIAPRDSGPAHEPWCEANVIGPCECKPRDSGKEG